jgi:hypothetical protein
VNGQLGRHCTDQRHRTNILQAIAAAAAAAAAAKQQL